MSLPPLLLARLKQRGIIKEDTKAEIEEEEVFAENYDQDEGNEEVDANEKYRGGAPGCPNKYNHYHVCSDYCFDHWQEGHPESRLPQKYLDQRQKMLDAYPLPSGWKEVYDSGMRRHYYWCQATDEVSWLSPKHPRAIISDAAQKIAKDMLENSKSARSDYSSSRKQFGNRDRGRDRDDRSDDLARTRKDQRYRGRDYERDARRRRREGSNSEEEEEQQKQSDNEADALAEELSERDKLRRAKRRGIDPMDPAAYGDADVGAWSAGLSSDGVKTGVDVTANGPLFQSRPYPAPGAILRRNNPNQEKKD